MQALLPGASRKLEWRATVDSHRGPKRSVVHTQLQSACRTRRIHASSRNRRQSNDTATVDDLRDGLGVIGGRSESLGRFMSSYAQLARLPRPILKDLSVADWIQRVAALESRISVDVIPGTDLTIQADGDQLDQLLINLLDNATDAAVETQGGVRIRWSESQHLLQVEVEDDGPGLAQTANLFVPFFTTKPMGSGIGLALGRQIAEAHGGSLDLTNRQDAPGCIARIRLPKREGSRPVRSPGVPDSLF